jgi:hypothetical protein
VAACVVGAPLGYSDGDLWSAPLVGTLEDGPPLVPVTIDGHGPYLFVANPNAMSVIDARLARTLGLYVYRRRAQLTDETDTVVHEKIDIAETRAVTIGTLTIRNRAFVAMDFPDRFPMHRVHGVLGSAFFDDTIVWAVDRDRQMLYLGTQGHLEPPPGATRVRAHRVDGGRFFIYATLDGRVEAYLFADFEHPRTQIRSYIAEQAGLEVIAGHALNYFGRRDDYRGVWRARTLAVGGVEARDMLVFPYLDRRVMWKDWDGRLGRDFFARFHVTYNHHRKSIWLAPRAPDLAAHTRERLRRWGPELDACATPACIRFAGVGAGGAEPLRITRDAAASERSYEVLVEATDRDGKPLRLARLLVAFPAGATEVTLDGAIADLYGAVPGLRVLDMSPFPAPCEPKTPGSGCVWLQ